MNDNMRLEKLENKMLIWTTNSQKNHVIYDSDKKIEEYGRKNLSIFERFLRENNELNKSNEIKEFLGKILYNKNIPKSIPTGSYKINTSISKLIDTIGRYIKEDGLNLNPDFQRGHVWNLNQRIRYIEFILQDGETPPIYFNHENWMGSYEGEMVIVDGKQRLTSLLMFLNNEFPVFKNLDKDNIGYYRKEFDWIPNDIIIVINNLKTKKQVLQWYLEMNSGQIQHTDEELDRVRKMLDSK